MEINAEPEIHLLSILTAKILKNKSHSLDYSFQWRFQGCFNPGPSNFTDNI